MTLETLPAALASAQALLLLSLEKDLAIAGVNAQLQAVAAAVHAAGAHDATVIVAGAAPVAVVSAKTPVVAAVVQRRGILTGAAPVAPVASDALKSPVVNRVSSSFLILVSFPFSSFFP